MSIILDALKKAQGTNSEAVANEGEVTGHAAGALQKAVNVSTSTDRKKTNKTRLVLLTVLAVLVLGYWMFGKKIIGKVSNSASYQKIAPKVLPKVVKHNVPDEDKKSEEEAAKEKFDEDRREALLNFQKGALFPKKYQESADQFKKLIELYPADAGLYNNYGLVLKKLGKMEEAYKAYLMAITIQPDYPEALNNIGVLELGTKSYNDARQHLERAVELNPDYIDANLHLGICMEKIGEVDLAKKYYQSYLHLSDGKVDRKLRLQIESRLSRLSDEN